jgi:hypothetical protein
MASVSLTVALIASGMTMACGGAEQTAIEPTRTAAPGATVPSAEQAGGPELVEGTIRGTSVHLDGSELDSITLSIFEGDSWGFNPSLLIFLFLDEGELPAGRTFTMRPDGHDPTSVHVHYRWRDPESGEIHTEMVTSGYELELKLGEIEDGQLPGSIVFAVPGEETRVRGSFRAVVNIEDAAS